MDKLIEFIKSYVSVSEETIDDLSKVCIYEEMKKGEMLLKEGSICRYIYFLEEGTARTFYVYNAKDVTSWIYPSGFLFTSWHSFITQKGALESIELLEDCSLIKISYTHYQKLLTEYSDFERFGRLYYEEQLSFIDEFYKGFMFMTAKERYDLLLSVYPDVTQQVNLGHIASLLGISQETLSRIRASR